MFTDVLTQIINDLNAHKRSRSDVMEKCVTNRLNDALKVYYEELTNSASYLGAKKEERILRAVDKNE